MSQEALPATGSVSVFVAVPPTQIWPLISDPATPARFSRELQVAAFINGSTATKGAVIEGHNARGTFEWTTLSTVTDCEEPRLFQWAVGDETTPVATWTFEVTPTDNGSTLTHSVVLHAGQPPLATAIEAEPERAHEIVEKRLSSLVRNMQSTVEGIASLCLE